jgi:hypothetical protein
VTRRTLPAQASWSARSQGTLATSSTRRWSIATTPARDDVDRAARHFEHADGADEVGVGAAPALHGEDDFGGRGGRIVAQRHGHGAGVSGEP